MFMNTWIEKEGKKEFTCNGIQLKDWTIGKQHGWLPRWLCRMKEMRLTMFIKNYGIVTCDNKCILRRNDEDGWEEGKL